MNREAAALGVPVYSFFRGTIGAVDKHLAASGKLILLETEQDIRSKLKLTARTREVAPISDERDSLNAVTNHIMAILDHEG